MCLSGIEQEYTVIYPRTGTSLEATGPGSTLSRKHAASSDLRRSGGVPTRRLKKESWN